MRRAANGFFYVNGTPTDCVHIAVTGLLDAMPEIIVSGINFGANMGDDTIYSGTVAGAGFVTLRWMVAVEVGGAVSDALVRRSAALRVTSAGIAASIHTTRFTAGTDTDIRRGITTMPSTMHVSATIVTTTRPLQRSIACRTKLSS